MIESEYHTAYYSDKIVDTWMFTNSTEVSLDFGMPRFGKTMIPVDYFGILAVDSQNCYFSNEFIKCDLQKFGVMVSLGKV